MFEIELPLRTVPESNRTREHWGTKCKRHNKQKLLMKAALCTCDIKPPCKITLTRIAPRFLDKYENLPMSFKWVVDAIAASLTGDYVPGRADSHPGLFFAYDQEKRGVREYAIKISILTEQEMMKDTQRILDESDELLKRIEKDYAVD